jgi:energy-coupling factor transporter ATP-binding protein EcfA2
LLDQHVERRTEFFKNHKVAHSHLKRAYERLKDIISQPTGTTIVKVIGLTGAGKTTLRAMIGNHLIEETLRELANDPSRRDARSAVIAPDSGALAREISRLVSCPRNNIYFAGNQLAVFQGASAAPLSESYGASEQRRKTANRPRPGGLR